MGGGTEGATIDIQKIAYHWNGLHTAPNSSYWTIYMGTTTKSEFDDETGWFEIGSGSEQLTQVYDGPVYIPAENKWIEITLQNHFNYNRVNNLVVAVRESSVGHDSQDYYFFCTNSHFRRSIRSYSNDIVPDPADPPTGTLSGMYPNIRLNFDAPQSEPVFEYSPKKINFGSLLFNSQNVTENVYITNAGATANQLILQAGNVEIIGDNANLFNIGDADFPFQLNRGQSAPIPICFTGNNEVGMHEATLKITYTYDNKTYEIYNVELKAIVLPESAIKIGDGKENKYLPINPFREYSYAQTIYMADDMPNESKIIERIAYLWNGHASAYYSKEWTIYMGHTSKEDFVNNTDWIDINELTQVFDGIVEYPYEEMWIDYDLDTPFVYNGNDNLIIAVHETQPGRNSHVEFFYSTDCDENRSLYCNQDITLPSPASPPAGNTIKAYPNIIMYFDDLSEDANLVVAPDSWTVNNVVINTTTSKKFDILNTGGESLTINNITLSGHGYFTLASDFTSNEYLASGAMCSFTVEYKPTEVGEHTTTISIETTAGNKSITLDGSCYDPFIREFPFFEGFETGNTEGSTVAYWNQKVAENYYWFYWTANNTDTYYNREPRTGDWNATLGHSSESTLVRPIILEKDKSYKLEFWARQDTDEDASIQATLSENDAFDEELFPIIEPSAVVSGDYQRFYGEFSVNNTGAYYLGIKGIVAFNPYYLSLDDISIDYNYMALPGIPVEIDENTTLTISGAGFIGAFESTVAPGNLTPIPNPNFVVTNHKVWQLIGSGTATLNISTTEEWFTYVSGGSWIALQGPLTNHEITIELDAKNTNFEFANGSGNNPSLPVELSSFSIVLNSSNRPVISWDTESETGVNGFYIYRGDSLELESATLISELVEATNSSLTHTYHFIDESLNEDGTYYYWLNVCDLNAHSTYYGPIILCYVHEEEDITPETSLVTKLRGAFPNPFNPGTNICFELAEPGEVAVRIYNIRGQLVRSFAPTRYEAGVWSIAWNGKDNGGREVSSGIYHIRMISGKKSFTSKALLMK